MKVLSLLVIIGLSAIVLARSVATNGPKKPFSLEEIFYVADKNVRASWISDTEIEYKNLTTGNIMMYNMKNEVVLVDSSVLKKYNCSSYEFSADKTYLLMRYDEKDKYRYSLTSRYVVYSLKGKKFTDVSQGAQISHAEWIPGRNAIIFIKNNDIYFSDMEKVAGDYRITETGVPGQFFNGVCDWVYEEEILHKATSFSISSDGQQLIYLSIDDRKVREAKFLEYGEPGSVKDQYETEITLPYPKPGTVMSTYQIWHFSIADRKTRLIAEYHSGRELFYGWKWVSNNSIAIVYANRVQNETETDLCHLKVGTCKKIFEDRNPKGWANFDVPFVSKNEDRYLARVRHKVGKNEFYHIYRFSMDGSKKSILTEGNFMVRDIVDWDEKAGVVFYQASEEDRPSSDHIYAVSENGDRKSTCITCQMKTPEQDVCKWGSVSFSRNFQYFIGTCSGPNPNVVSLYAWSESKKIKLLRTLDESPEMRKLMSERLQPKKMDLTVLVTDTMAADVRLLLPPDIDTSGKKKYPLLIYVYGGPDSPRIKDLFRLEWTYYLTTNRSVIYGAIDGRGTGRRGTAMMYALYKAFGTVEVQDQITVVRNISNTFGFIDKSRIGIWGWSYGGYATAKVLENDVNGIFKCGTSIAPVTDWLYYDSAYTERYMDLPSANPEGYRRSSTLYNVENLRNKQYLLMHGTGDDNVLYQHSMHLARVLQKRNIFFEQQSYTDEGHKLAGVRPNAYFMMDLFFRRCLSY